MSEENINNQDKRYLVKPNEPVIFGCAKEKPQKCDFPENFLLDHIHDSIIGFDNNYFINYWNKASEKVYGWTAEEAAGKKSFDLLKTVYVGCSMEEVTTRLKKEGFATYEAAHLTKDGKQINVDVHSAALYSDNGELNGFVSSCRNITEQKKFEVLLQKKAKETQIIMDSMPAMVFYKDKENRFIRTNKNFEDAMNMPKEKLEGVSLFEIYPKEQAEAFWKDDLEVINSGEAKRNIVEPMETQSGTRWVQTDKIPHFDENGKVTGIIGFAIDITEQKENQSELARLASFPKLNPNPIVELDLDGKLIYQNPSAILLFPDLSDKLTNHPFLEGFKGILEELLNEKKYKTNRELPVGDKYYYKTIHYLPEEKKLRFYGTDITDLKNKEKELEANNRILSAISKSNHLMIHAKSESKYAADVCNIIFNDCGYKMVWVGITENNEQKTIRPIAFAGFEKGYLETLKLTFAPEERGRGPTGTAVREGRTVICKNMQEDPQFLPWKEEAIKRGYMSSIAFPLFDNKKIFGAVTIYSEKPDPFSKEEINLLKELVSDVGTGIVALRIKQAKEKAENALKKSREYAQRQANNLRIVLNTAPAVIFISQDKDCKNIIGNNTAYEFLNVMKGTNLSKLADESESLSHYKMLKNNRELKAEDLPVQKVSRTGKELIGFEYDFLFDSGQKRTLLGNVKPILGFLGEPAGAVGIFFDVTEQKKIEHALKIHSIELEKITEELKKVQLAVENASDIIFITDSTGKIIYVNKAAKILLRYSQYELIGKKLNFWKKNAPNKFFDEMWNTIYFQKKPFTGEIQEKKKTGEFFTAEVKISPVLDKDGKILSFVGIERDITEAKKLDIAKTEFISLAAHQLRTPITTVNLTAEMLLRGLAGEMDKDTKVYLNDIVGGIKKMSEMIELFLDVSRIEMRTFEINPHEIDINKVIEENIKYVKPQADLKNLQIKTDIPLNFPPVKIDQKVMDTILENILSNAIKYTSNNGEINVALGKDSENIIIEISDNGVGIPKEQQDLVFDKLFRADNVDENTQGVGLGLYVVKSLVDQAGGKIWLTSEKDKGASFFISFPLSGMNESKKKK